MTSAQLEAARILIPTAYELKAPRGSHTEAVSGASATADSYIVAAPAKPTTRWGFAAAVLWDLTICMVLIYGVALAPGFVIKGITAAASLLLNIGDGQ